MAIDELLFAKLRDRFTDEWKKIEPTVSDRRTLTKNLAKRAEYRDKLSYAFNAICTYLLQVYYKSDKLDDKLECVARITPYIEKCKKAFSALKLTYNWPVEELRLIEIQSIQSIDEPLPSIAAESSAAPSTSTHSQAEVASSTASSDQFVDAEQSNDSRIDAIIQNLSQINTESDSETEHDTEIEQQTTDQAARAVQSPQDLQTEQRPQDLQIEQLPQDLQIETNSTDNSTENSTIMPQSKEDFFKMASAVIKEKFDGDPLKLDSFITDAEFVESMTETANKDTFLKFIKTKISGRAKECLPENDTITSFDIIKNALQKDIKPDSSIVVEGKMATLRLSKGDFTKFAEEAEKLAEAYRRSLIFEKYPREKAAELTIRKTKELCRRTARNDVVKSVIDSTQYDNPAEVIATYITQNDVARKEKKEFDSFQKRPQNKGGQKGQKYDNKNKKNGNYNKGNKFNKNKSNDNQGAKGRGSRNDHVIRIVSDASPSTSSDSKSNANTEQVFRLDLS